MRVRNNLKTARSVVFVLALSLIMAGTSLAQIVNNSTGYFDRVVVNEAISVVDPDNSVWTSVTAIAGSVPVCQVGSEYYEINKQSDKVFLTLDESFKPDKDFTLTVTFSIKLYDQTNTLFDQRTSQAITLTYSKDKPYDHTAQYVLENTKCKTRMDVQILSISNPGNISLDYVKMGAQIAKSKIMYMPDVPSQTVITGISGAYSATDNALNLTWTVAKWASSYEVQWVYIDTYDPLIPGAKTVSEEFMRAGTKVITNNANYSIPLLYDKGYILYRVRGSGRTRNTVVSKDIDIAGLWSDQAVSFPIAVTSYPTKYLLATPHALKLNWQSTLTFAEEGKKMVEASYYDGISRQRQSLSQIELAGLTNMKTTMVGETVYDAEGRAAVTILPAPTFVKDIRFMPGFNLSDATPSKNFSALDFDKESAVDNCKNTIVGLSTTSGASKYYSPNNTLVNDPVLGRMYSAVPDALKYPYTLTVYTDDNTGRVREQSGVGSEFKVGSDRTTKYFYGKPFQDELDRLFGSDVGYAINYKRNMVRDANGQYNITYLDLTGRVIATSLAGNKPDNVSKLTTYRESDKPMAIDLLNKIRKTDRHGMDDQLFPADGKRVLTSQFTIAQNGTREFYYELKNNFYQPLCLDNYQSVPGVLNTSVTAASFNIGTTSIFPGTASTIYDMKVADIDYDLDMDVVLAYANKIVIMQNNVISPVFTASQFTLFEVAVPYAISGRSILLTDLESDQMPELIVYAGNSFTVYKNLSNQQFPVFEPFITKTTPAASVIRGMVSNSPNAAGRNQLVALVTHASGNNLYTYEIEPRPDREGLYYMNAPVLTSLSTTGTPDHVWVEDVHSNAGNEVIVSTTSSYMYVFGTTLTSLVSKQFSGLPTGNGMRLAFADMDGDKLSDIVAYNGASANVYGILYTQLSAGSPSLVKTFGANIKDLALQDFNRNGKADIVAIAGGNLSFIENTSLAVGTISFGSVTNSATSSTAISACDLNEDSRMDFIHVDGTAIKYANNIIKANPACYECVIDVNISLKSKECGDEYLPDLVNVSGQDRNYTTIGPIQSITSNPDFFPMNACGAQPTVFKRGNPTACSGCVVNDVCDVNATACSWMGNKGLNIKDGEYLISRTLKVNEKALNIYTNNYIKNNDCLKTLKDFEKEAFDQIDFSQCDITCEERYRRLGNDYASSLYNETYNPDCAKQYGCLTELEYNNKREEYEIECGNQQTGCESYYVQLIADMSPGGQYGKTRPTPAISDSGDISEMNMQQEEDPSVFPLSVYNDNNQLPQRVWLHTEVENYHKANSIPMLSASWIPGWRYPVNGNAAVGTHLRHSYVDANGQIDYVMLSVDANGAFVPAVHPNYMGQVVYDNTLKIYKIRPQFLLHVKDFLANWKESWAISLIVYHPEFGYLYQCMLRAESNRWDDAWFEVDNAASFNLPDGTPVMGATDKYQWWNVPPYGSTFNDFKTNATNRIRDDFKDPYFSAANAGNLLPGEMDAFLGKLWALTKKGTQFKNAWEVSYAAVNCSEDCPSPCFFPGTLNNTDAEWRMFRGIYQSIKQEIIKRHDVLIAIRDGFYNGCISTEPFDVNKDLFIKAYYQPPVVATTPGSGPPRLIQAIAWPYNSNWSYYFFQHPAYYSFATTQFYNFEQTCNANRYHLYKGKHARFYPELTNIEKPSSEVCSISDFSAFEIPFCEEKVNAIIDEIKGKNIDKIQRECKQCDLAFYFSEFINQITQEDAFKTAMQSSNYFSEFFDPCSMNRSSAFSNMQYVFRQYVTRQNPSVTTFSFNYQTSIDYVNKTWTHTLQNNGFPVLSLTMNLPDNFRLTDLKRVCCLRGIDNPGTEPYEFEMDVQLQQRPGANGYNGMFENIPGANGMPNVATVKMSGTTDVRVLVQCERDRYCVKTDLATTLQTFLNGLVYKEPKLFFSSPPTITPYSLPWISYGKVKNLILSKCMENQYSPTPLAGLYNAEMFQAFGLLSFGDFVGDDIRLSMDDASPTKPVFYIGNVDTAVVGPTSYLDTLRKFYCSFTLDLGGTTLADISRFSGVTAKDGVVKMYGFTTSGSRVDVIVSSSCLDLVKCYNELDDEARRGHVATFEELRKYKNPVTKCKGLFDEPVVVEQDIEVYDSAYNCYSLIDTVYPLLNPPISMGHILALLKMKLDTSNINRPVEGIYEIEFKQYDIDGGSGCLDCNFKIVSSVDLSTLTPDTIVGIGRVWGSKWVHNIYIKTEDGPKPLLQAIATTSCRNIPRYKSNGGGSPSPSVCQPLCPLTPMKGVNFALNYGKLKTYWDDTQFPGPTYREFAPDSNEFMVLYDPLTREFNTAFTGQKKVRLYTNPTDSLQYSVEHEVLQGEYCMLSVPPQFNPVDCYFNPYSLVFRLEGYYIDPAYKQVWQRDSIVVLPNTEYTFRFTFRDLFLSNVNDRWFDHPQVTINGITPSVALKHDGGNWVYEYYWRSNSDTMANIEIKARPSENTMYTHHYYGLSSLYFFADCKQRVCCPPILPTIMLQSSCRQMLYNIARDNANKAYLAYVDTIRTRFRQGYMERCLDVFESFNMRYQSNEDHFTLFYYDQAGNLVRTVPPKGVQLIEGADSLEKIKEERFTGVRTISTAHRMATTYKYNSLNQLVYQSTPDQDDMSIYTAQENVNAFNTAQKFNDLSFADNSIGYAVSEDRSGSPLKGHIFKTEDRGMTWKELNAFGLQDINDKFEGTYYDAGGIPTTVWFAVGNKGQLITKSPADVYQIRSLPTANDLFRVIEVYYNSVQSFCIIERNGTMWTSKDGGATWQGPGTSLKLKLQGTLTDVRSAGTGICYAICDKGYIYRSVDGGIVWSIINKNNTKVAYALNKVILTGGTNALVFGDNGSVIKADLAATDPAPWEETVNNLGGNITDAVYTTTGVAIIHNNRVWNSVDGLKSYGSSPFQNVTSGAFVNMHLADIKGLAWVSNRFYAMTNLGQLAVSSNESPGSLFIPYDYIPGMSGTVTSFKQMDITVSPGVIRSGFVVGTSTGRAYFRVFGVHSSWQLVSPLSGVTQPVYDVNLTFQSSKYYVTARCNGKAVGANSGGTLVFTDMGLGSAVTFVDVKADYKSVIISGNDLYTSSNHATVAYASVLNDAFLPDVISLYEYQSGKYLMVDSDGEMRLVDVNPGALAPIVTKTTSINYKHKLNSITTFNNVGTPKLGIVGEAGMYLVSDFTYYDAAAIPTWQIRKTGVVASLNDVIDDNTQVVAVGDNATLVRMSYSHSSVLSEFASGYNTTHHFNSVLGGGSSSFFITSGTNKLIKRSTAGVYTDLTVPGLTAKATGISTGVSGHYVWGNSGNIWTYDGVNTLTPKMTFASPVLKGAKMVSASTGFAVGSEGTIWKTVDAGGSWNKIAISEAAYSLTNLVAVHFNDPQHGVIIGKHNTNTEAVAFTTSDGGNTWVRTLNPATKVFTDVSGNRNHMLITGEGGLLYHSQNYGATWALVTTGITTHLNAVHVPSPGKAFVTGASGRVLAVNLLGVSAVVTALQPNTGVPVAQRVPNVDIKDIYFKDEMTGYVAGAGKTFYKTIDGGNIWEQLVYTSVTEDAMNLEPRDAENLLVMGEGTTTRLYNVYDMKNEFSTRFWYDRLGRLVVTQNSKQYLANNKRYGYTIFDAKGRVIESGEGDASNVIDAQYQNGKLNDASFKLWTNTLLKRQVVRTYYDVVQLAGMIPVSFTQENLRNRVSAVTYQEGTNPAVLSFAAHYSYDIHGNVKDVLTDNSYMHPVSGAGLAYDELMFKKISYKYDLLSGKINYVSYQEGKADQFFHQYKYDNQNRIAMVYTSTDGRNWEKDASYEYYLHGPIARTEIGEDNIQGLDQIYTLQGWLKSLNSPRMDNTKFDLGQDGMQVQYHAAFPLDEVGYSLGYFGNDYRAVKPATLQADHFMVQTAGTDVQPATGDLYNGNIGHMLTGIRQFDPTAPLASVYKYDQLGRIITANYFNNLNTTSNVWSTGGAAMNDYKNNFSYDANGNILTQKRNGSTASNIYMDNLVYIYDANRNRLKGVNDSLNKTLYAEDVDHQNVTAVSANRNYDYDATGNLIKDQVEEIANIDWNVQGKIKRVTRVSGSVRPDLQFEYGMDGNRVMKKTIPKGAHKYPEVTLYARDAQGNVMATYTKKYTDELDLSTIGLGTFNQHLYDLIGPDSFYMFSSFVIASATPGDYDAIRQQFTEEWGFDLNLLRGKVDPAKAIVAAGHMGCMSSVDHEFFYNAVGNAPDSLTQKLFRALCACDYTAELDQFLDYLFQNEQFFDAYFTALYDLSPALSDWMMSEMGLSPGLSLSQLHDLYQTDPYFLKSTMWQVFHQFDACNIMGTAMVNAKANAYDAYLEILQTWPQQIIDLMVNHTSCPKAQEAIVSMLFYYDANNLLSLLEGCIGSYTDVWNLILDYDLASVLIAVIKSEDMGGMDAYTKAVEVVYNVAYYAEKAGQFLPPARYDELMKSLYDSYPTFTEYTYLDERYLYGSSRVGSSRDDLLISTVKFSGYYNPTGDFQTAGVLSASVMADPSTSSGRSEYIPRRKKQFEIANHLGNVLVTVNDVKDAVTQIKWIERFVTPGVFTPKFTLIGGATITHISGTLLRIGLGSNPTPRADYDIRTGTSIQTGKVYQLYFDVVQATTNRGRVTLLNGGETQLKEIYPGSFVFTFTAQTTNPVLRFSNLYNIPNYTITLDSMALTELVNYKANVVNANDYSPFGAPLPDREYHKGQRDSMLVNLSAGNWNLPGWQYWGSGISAVESGGKLKISGTDKYSGAYYQFPTVKGRVYRVRYKLTNSTMPFVNTAIYSPIVAANIFSMAEMHIFTDDREMVFTAEDTISQFYVSKGWSATPTTPLQYVHLDYVNIYEVPDQINYVSCSEISAQMESIVYTGISLSDTTTIKNRLNNCFRRTHTYAEWSGMMQSCSTGYVVRVAKKKVNAWDGDGYRFGFNGQERDDATTGEGNTYDFGARIYDARLGRFLSIDPASFRMPGISPYSYALNSPMIIIDHNGEYPKPSELLTNLGVKVDPMIAGLMDGFVEGLGVFDAAEFAIKLASSPEFREEMYQTFVTIASDPVAFAQSVANGYIEKGKEILSGSDKGKYELGHMVGELAGGAVTGAAALKLIKLAKNFKSSKLVANAIRYKPCGCFTAGTIVLTSKGNKYIEEIAVGDSVWAYDDSMHVIKLQKVIDVFTRDFDQYFKVYFNGNVLQVTHEHPFFINGSWVKAESLKKGDRLTTYNENNTVLIDSVVFVDNGNLTKVYNFTVEGYHTYYVSEDGVLVHNGNPCGVIYKYEKGVLKAFKAEIIEVEKLGHKGGKKYRDTMRQLQSGGEYIVKDKANAEKLLSEIGAKFKEGGEAGKFDVSRVTVNTNGHVGEHYNYEFIDKDGKKFKGTISIQAQ